MDSPPNWHNKLSAATAGGAQYIFAEDTSDGGAKRYTKDFTPEQMIVYQNRRDPSERNFYEWMLADKPVKLFYDIDFYGSYGNTELIDALVNSVIRTTITSLNEMFNVNDINTHDFAVLDSSGEVVTPAGKTKKTSIHIVLARKACFREVKFLKHYVTYVFSEKSGYISSKQELQDLHLDFGVYRFGCLRIPGSTKRGQNRHLRIITQQFSELDCLITNIDSSFQQLEAFLKKNNKRKESHLMHVVQSRISLQQYTNDDIYAQVVDALPAFLASDYSTWINVGIKLYVAGAPEKYWHDFSKKSIEQYEYVKAHEKWETFRNYGRGSTAGLLRLLREHGRHEVADQLVSHSLKYMSKYNNDIAAVLARLYGDDHVYSKGSWFFYNGLRWIEDVDRTHISRTIMTRFQYKIDSELRSVNDYLINNDPNNPGYNDKIQQSKNLIAVKEKTQSGRIGIDFHVLEVAFENERFKELLDSNLDLIGFNNGVYDLSSGVFRESSRDDRITRSVGYDYDGSDCDNSQLDIFLQQVFPEPLLLQYMLFFLGSCLSGRVNEELIHFFTGVSSRQTGSNGKSSLITLLLQVFGDYASMGHGSILVSKRENSQNSNSALMSLKGKRAVFFSEIENEQINMSVIKSLTGNDVISGRQMYKTQECFKPEWKIIVCANKLPNLSQEDGGVYRRIRNVPFLSKFVENVEDPQWSKMRNVYQIDYNLKIKLEQLKMPLMNKLIDYYNRYIQMDGLPVCDSIRLHTTQYLQNQNPVYQFIQQSLIQKQGSMVSMKDFFHQFNVSGLNISRLSMPEVIEFIEYHISDVTFFIDEHAQKYIMHYTFS
jgi:P4 family phage/plasmid primase-like protien